MLEIAAVAFTTFFATVGPIEAAAIFAGITPDKTAAQRRSLAIRGCIISAGILLSFAFFGLLYEHGETGFAFFFYCESVASRAMD